MGQVVFISIGGEASPVESVFGRVGDVVAASGDYSSDQVPNDSTVAGSSTTAALNTLNTSKANAASTVMSGDVAGGDLSGTYPNPSVAKLQERAVVNTLPTLGQQLTWVTANSRWEPV